MKIVAFTRSQYKNRYRPKDGVTPKRRQTKATREKAELTAFIHRGKTKNAQNSHISIIMGIKSRNHSLTWLLLA